MKKVLQAEEGFTIFEKDITACVKVHGLKKVKRQKM